MWGRDASRRLRWLVGLALVASVGLVSPGPAWAIPARTSGGQKSGDKPCKGKVVGFLGITGMICRACTLSLNTDATSFESQGGENLWSFSVEPRVTAIDRNSPAARALRAGDTIVAIDGHLITTVEGGRRFANIEPGRTVTIRYRRQGRVEDAVLRPEARCWPSVEGVNASQFVPGSEGAERRWSLDAPRVRVQIDENADGSKSNMTVSYLDGGGSVLPRTHDGLSLKERLAQTDDTRLGISWIPERSASGTMKNGRRLWKFSGPVRVSRVVAGGPADKAGIRPGDRITAVDKEPIESRQGGNAFSDLRAGQATLLTLTRPDGSVQTVTVVPVAHASQDVSASRRTTVTLEGARSPREDTTPGAARGFVGMNFSCGPCSTTWKDGREVWTFSGPVHVFGVEVGGPADRAGIRLGDEITAVDGKPIQSAEGAAAFSDLRPGQPTRFTLVGRDGRERTVTVVPAGREGEGHPD